MGSRAVRRIPGPRRDAVAPAIGGVAEERAAFGHFETLHSGPPRPFGFSLRSNDEGVGNPLPHIAHEIIQPVAVGFERSSGCCRLIAVETEVAMRELALPDVARKKAFVVRISVAPRITCIFHAAASGVLPFCLRWQTTADPPGVLLRVVPRNVHNWVVLVLIQHRSLGAGAIDVAPSRAINPSPPFDFYYTLCWSYIVADLGPENERPAESFSFCHVAGCVDKSCELRVCDRSFANAEGPYTFFPERTFGIAKNDGFVSAQKGHAARYFD